MLAIKLAVSLRLHCRQSVTVMVIEMSSTGMLAIKTVAVTLIDQSMKAFSVCVCNTAHVSVSE